MTAVITDVAGICNLALAKIGYRLRIGSLYDGTLASKKLLDVYGQTRDALLRAGDWNFAQKTAVLVAGGTPVYPWTNSWIYPADCLRVRNVYDPSATVDIFNPLPTLWQVADDAVAGRIIFTRAGGINTVVYTLQETDPSEWDTLFIDALATALGRNLRSLAENKEDANLVKLGAEEIANEIQVANEVTG